MLSLCFCKRTVLDSWMRKSYFRTIVRLFKSSLLEGRRSEKEKQQPHQDSPACLFATAIEPWTLSSHALHQTIIIHECIFSLSLRSPR